MTGIIKRCTAPCLGCVARIGCAACIGRADTVFIVALLRHRTLRALCNQPLNQLLQSVETLARDIAVQARGRGSSIHRPSKFAGGMFASSRAVLARFFPVTFEPTVLRSARPQVIMAGDPACWYHTLSATAGIT